jgi:hypothetical protein
VIAEHVRLSVLVTVSNIRPSRRAAGRRRAPPSVAVALLACAGLCACSQRQLLMRLVPMDSDRFARAFIDSLQASPESARGFLTPALAASRGVLDTLDGIRRKIAVGSPGSLEVVGADVVVRNGSTLRQVRYQVGAGNAWAIVQVVLEEQPSGRRVAGVRVWPRTQSLEAQNALTLRGASPAALVVSLLWLVGAAFSLYAALRVLRSPLKLKWLWATIALLGYGRVGVEWNTGVLRTDWHSLHLAGFGIVRDGLYGPWWVFVSLPAGAFLALDRRRRAVDHPGANALDEAV